MSPYPSVPGPFVHQTWLQQPILTFDRPNFFEKKKKTSLVILYLSWAILTYIGPVGVHAELGGVLADETLKSIKKQPCYKTQPYHVQSDVEHHRKQPKKSEWFIWSRFFTIPSWSQPFCLKILKKKKLFPSLFQINIAKNVHIAFRNGFSIYYQKGPFEKKPILFICGSKNL